MGFVGKSEHRKFLDLCPEIEGYIVDGGIILLKFWLEVGQDEQERRFLARINDPLRQWKLSPMDLESYRLWYEYSKARDLMQIIFIDAAAHGYYRCFLRGKISGVRLIRNHVPQVMLRHLKRRTIERRAQCPEVSASEKCGEPTDGTARYQSLKT